MSDVWWALVLVGAVVGLVVWRYPGWIRASLRALGIELDIGAGRVEVPNGGNERSVAQLESDGDLRGVAVVAGHGNTVSIGSPESAVRAADLRLIRADVLDGDEADSFPLLDVTIENTGTTSGVLHELVLEQVQVFPFPASAWPEALEVSWTYDADLSQPGQTVRISEVVPPAGAARFQVRLGTTQPIYPYLGHFLYWFRASAVHGHARSVLDLGAFLVRITQPAEVHGSYRPRMSASLLRLLTSELNTLEGRLASMPAVIHAAAAEALDEIRSVVANPPPVSQRDEGDDGW